MFLKNKIAEILFMNLKLLDASNCFSRYGA